MKARQAARGGKASALSKDPGLSVVPDGSAQGGPKRVDAQRNRERIIQTAFQVLGEQGVDAGMVDIAKAAGFGVGTVYRNFPSKEALVNALIEERLQQAMNALDIVEAKHMDAWEALVKLIRSIMDRQFENRVLSQFFGGRIQGSPELQEKREAVYMRFQRLMEQAKRDGKLRRDVAVSDLRVAMVSISHLASNDSPVAQRLVARQVEIILDGLREPPAHGKLEGRPPTIRESEEVFRTQPSPQAGALRPGRRSWPT